MGISCLLYTSDAADDLLCVDLGGRRIIKKVGVTTILVSHDREDAEFMQAREILMNL